MQHILFFARLLKMVCSVPVVCTPSISGPNIPLKVYFIADQENQLENSMQPISSDLEHTAMNISEESMIQSEPNQTSDDEIGRNLDVTEPVACAEVNQPLGSTEGRSKEYVMNRAIRS
jgi:hypothetical protein